MIVPWTEDRVEQLRKLRAEGLSASQIAAHMGEGMTRNAVIGKCNRIGLKSERTPTFSKPREIKAPLVRKTGGRRKPWTRIESILRPDGKDDLPPDSSQFAVSWMDASEAQCRWPMSDHTKCCGDTVFYKSWCVRHADLGCKARRAA